jgi:hypothetical protein
MVVEPVVIPVIRPDDGSTVATDVAELLQVPPLVAFVKVVVEPVHTELAPLIAPGLAGTVFTVTGVVI